MKAMVLLLMTCMTSLAWANLCETQDSGNWEDTTTWVGCNGNIPQNNDVVTIKGIHTVTLSSATNNLESIFVEPGGDINIGANAGNLAVINVNDALSSNIDLSNATMDLSNNLTINAQNKDIFVGTVDGTFDLTLNSSGNTTLANTIGANVKIKSLITDAPGVTYFAAPNGNISSVNFIVDETIEIHDVAKLTLATHIRCQNGTITFYETLDSAETNRAFYISGSNSATINLNDNIGSINELNTFQITNSNAAIANINTSEVKTTNSQRWDLNVVLNSPTQDVLLSSSNGFDIRLGKANRTFSVRSLVANSNSLTIDTVGTVSIMSNIGDNNQALKYLIVNSPSNITLTKDEIIVNDTAYFVGPVILANDYLIKGQIVDVQSDLDNGGFDLTIDATSSSVDSKIIGVLSGSGSFFKNGIADLNLSSINSITGNITINGGTIINKVTSDNIFPFAPVISLANGTQAFIGNDSTFVFKLANNQNLIGNGVCECILTAESGAAISPGFSPGQLSINTLTMNTGSSLNIEINGNVVGSGYDQLITNTLDLDGDTNGGATLNLVLGYVPIINDSFTILDVQTATPINGILNGLIEGATFIKDGYLYSISYVGGDGNDVELTVNASARSYVNASNTSPVKDGLTWATAFDNLQDALAVATIGEIWVAQGIYYPDIGSSQVNNDRFSTFTLVSGVSVYGGFNGTETDVSMRDPVANVTVLSGDIDGNDAVDGDGVTAHYSDLVSNNAYHIVSAEGVDNTTLIDGFTITGGWANGTSPYEKGAAIYCNVSSVGINAVIVQGNDSTNRANLWKCSSTISQSSFINNIAGRGAVSTTPAIFSDVMFFGNTATVSNTGRVFDLTSSNTLSLTRAKFIANWGFGPIIKESNTTLDFNDVLFSGNNGDANILISGTSSGTLNNITMTGNSDGINSTTSSFININNSIMWNNKSSVANVLKGNINHTGSGIITVKSSIVQGLTGDPSWGTGTLVDGSGNLDENPLFIIDTDPTTAPTSVGNAHLNVNSPAIGQGNDLLVTQAFDLDGNPRIVNTVEMGAYEFASSPILVDVSGLVGTLVLQNNGGDDLTISTNATHAFSQEVARTNSYSVSIFSQSTSVNQTCILSNGNGVFNNDPLTNITVICTTLQYNVDVTVSGLAATNSIGFSNGVDGVTFSSDGTQTLSTLADGSSYDVLISSAQLVEPNQSCVITSNNANGTLSGEDELVTIACTTSQYNVGVDVSGLANGNSVEFKNNGESLTVTADGQFNFATALDDGSSYVVSVTSQPTTPNQICSVVAGLDDLSGADVLITVTCTTNQYFVGGMASGLANGNSVSLSLGAEDLTVNSNAAFVFLNPLVDEADYIVSVASQPTVPSQTCDLVNPTGTIAGNDISDIEVNCITNQYLIGGFVSGLHAGNNLEIQNNNGDDLTITSSGDFDFATPIGDLQIYDVSILNQPSNPIQPCVISNKTGNVSGAAVTTVSIICEFGDDLIFSNDFE